MLLEYPRLIDQRKVFDPEFKSLVIDIVGVNQWNERFANRNQLVQLILDCSVFPVLERLPVLHYSVDCIFLSFGIMGFIVGL